MGIRSNELEQMFSEDTYQLTGVAVSKDGRLFYQLPISPFSRISASYVVL
jgi:hypothetical protein